jgi:hypothetical protein
MMAFGAKKAGNGLTQRGLDRPGRIAELTLRLFDR